MIEEVREMLNEKASLEREYLELVHISDEMNLSAEIHDKMIMANIAHSLSVIADALADRKTEPQTDYKKWDAPPKVDLPTENTTCVGVAMALVENEFFREPTAEERKAVADYIDSISVPTGVNVFDLTDEPQERSSE